jgi:RNA polymerase sigma factor (sigma-70 family)
VWHLANEMLNEVNEVLSDATVLALSHADTFDASGTVPSHNPKAWFLYWGSIAIMRMKAARGRDARRGASSASLASGDDDVDADGAFFERMLEAFDADPADEVISKDEADRILSLVSKPERRILEMVLLEGYDGKTLAQELGITPANARVRLHRALKHLRDAWYSRDRAR